jgi:hypothetical protein
MNFKKIFCSSLAFIFLFMNCRQEKKDNSLTLAALFLLDSATPKALSGTAAKNTGTVTASAAAAVSQVGTSVSAGNISYNLFPQNKINSMEFLTSMRQREFSKLIKSLNIQSSSLATGTGGATCSGSTSSSDGLTCTGTINGTANCSYGGTIKMVNLVTTYSNKITNQSAGASTNSTTAKGNVTLTNCGSQQTNFYDFPSLIATSSSGNITFDGKMVFNTTSYKQATSSSSFNQAAGTATTTIATVDQELTVSREFTASSSDFSSKGTSLAFSGLTEKMNVTVVSKGTDLKIVATFSGNTASKIVASANYEDTINGTITTTGTVGGQTINAGYNYDKSKVYKYSYNCTFDVQTPANNDCTITLK